MKRQLMISLCATAAMVALAACESDPTFTSQSTAMDWESTKTMIRGDEADTVLIDDQLLEDAVRDMGATGSSNNIKTLISEVRAQNGGKGGKGLSGLGGAFGHAFFDAAEDALKNNGKIDKQERVTTTTFGKIIDYEYAFSPTDWSIGSGRLHVITMVETVKNKRNPNPNPPPPKVTRQAFKWEISVSSGGFEVHDKVAGDQPFPGTMVFSVPMKTRVDLLGFEYKLWAEGNAIEIDNVYHAGNSFDPANWADPGEWTLVPKTGGGPLKKYQGLYDIDQHSCIDLMFVPFTRNPPSGPPIPINMNELSAPPFYCLGRCDDPPIINTK